MLILQNKSTARHVRGHGLHKMLFYAFYKQVEPLILDLFLRSHHADATG